MLSRLVEFSLAQRLLMLVLTALLVGAGIMAFHNLPIDAFPDVSTTQVKIIMKAPGMTPEEVEARIVVPIEQEMLGIPKQRILRTEIAPLAPHAALALAAEDPRAVWASGRVRALTAIPQTV